MFSGEKLGTSDGDGMWMREQLLGVAGGQHT